MPGWVLMLAAAGYKFARPSEGAVLWLWLAGAGLLLGGAYWVPRQSRTPEGLKSARWVWGMGLLVVAFGAALRLYGIDTIPRYVHCDEGTTVMIGQGFFDNPARDWFGPMLAGSYTTMSLCFALAGWGAWLGGFNLVAARIPDVALGIPSIALVFDGLRRTSNLRVASAGALLLAANHCHLHYSRIASSYIQTAFVVALAFAIWSRVWTRPTLFNTALLGVAMALGIQTYRASMAALPLLTLAMALLWLLHAERRRVLLRPFMVFALSCATASAVHGVALWQNLDQMTVRSRELNIFTEHAMNGLKRNVYPGYSTAEVVAAQTWLALRGFHKGHDHQPQYQIHLPMADRYTAALMVPGVALALLSARQFVVLNALVFTVGYLFLGLGMQWAPGFNRATGALPLAMVFPAIALVQCCGVFWGGRTRPTAWLRDLSIAAGLALCVAANLNIYFFEYPYSRVYGDADSEAGWVARKYVGQYTIHLVNWTQYGHEGLRLIVGDLDIPWHDERNDTVAYVNRAGVSGADLFIIDGHDAAARDAAMARFPKARLEEWRRHPTQGPTLFLVFVGEPRHNGRQ